ncbi:branched-chain amino acid ABC transporter substrate-binding protein [Herbaspirillum rhizosphaerae]|uniref:Branched-chain amino acid ABC transporter substrate-binding protein n=1 Tax=Herbaspirillum rhizosphaerae TaxID=346179 RepID=A0ABW8Z874_9BURK
MHPFLRLMNLTLCCALLGTAPYGAAAAEALPEILIGFAAPMSGSSDEFGKSLANAAQLAVDEANARGITIGGRKMQLQLVIQDDRSDARTAALGAEYLVKKGVIGVIGNGSTTTTLATAPIYSLANIPQITPSASSKEITERGYKTMFRIIGHDDDGGTYAGNYAVNTLQAQRIAVIDNNTPFGIRFAAQFSKAVTEAGGKIVSKSSISDKTSDFNTLLADARSDKVDLIFFSGFYKQAGELARNIKRLGVQARLMTGSNGAVGLPFLQIAGPAANGVIGMEMGPPLEKMTGWRHFENAYISKFGPNIDLYAPYAYDSAQALINALKQANSTDPVKITAALHRIRFNGLTGAIAFDSDGNLQAPVFSIYTVEDQKWTVTKIINTKK